MDTKTKYLCIVICPKQLTHAHNVFEVTELCRTQNPRCTGKHNDVINNEKKPRLLLLEQQKNDRSSSLFFSSKLAGPPYFREVLNAQVCSLACVSFYRCLTEDKDKGGSAKVINLGM